MNFLKICQIADNMSGLQGEITNVELAVAAQNVIVQSVRQGFLDLQLDRMSWKFMRRTKVFNTIVDQQVYPILDIFGNPVNDFGRWEERVGRRAYYIRDIATGKARSLVYINYDMFRDKYLRNPTTSGGKPRYITSDPATESMMLDTAPSEVYEISADYFVEPQVLETNEDIPILPNRFHQLLAYKALPYIGGHYSNLSISSTYAIAEAKMQGMMYRDQCPSEQAKTFPVA